MVRAPCCEKMGLKRGPWTAEEDHILVSYIQRYGHGNWRALPRQAGLLRCGKSCRLRWMNYLRPDIKRGHFTNEEEDAIINLHQLLGNRWSAIAARLPGRTDNEIKNVWHTHLKKRVKANPAATQHPKRINHNNKVRRDAVAVDMESEPILQPVAVNIIINPAAAYNAARYDEDASPAPTSPPGQYSCSDCDFSSSSTATVDDCSTSTATTTTTTGFAAETANATASSVLNYEEDYTGSSEKLLDMDESFWSEALTTLDGNSATSTNWDDLSTTASINQCYSLPDHLDQLVVGGGDFHGTDASSGDDDADFWLRVFMQAGGLPELPGF